jgi:predicted nuclease of predicted toxin-antitoxin system
VRLLLNEQVNPRVAAELRRKGYDVATVNDLGTRGVSDPQQLAAAAAERRALVTYNIADFQKLLIEWSERGLTHWGIIFVSERTISQRSVGPLARALELLLKDFRDDEALLHQAIYLTKG